jgi:hypothetical protein
VGRPGDEERRAIGVEAEADAGCGAVALADRDPTQRESDHARAREHVARVGGEHLGALAAQVGVGLAGDRVEVDHRPRDAEATRGDERGARDEAAGRDDRPDVVLAHEGGRVGDRAAPCEQEPHRPPRLAHRGQGPHRARREGQLELAHRRRIARSVRHEEVHGQGAGVPARGRIAQPLGDRDVGVDVPSGAAPGEEHRASRRHGRMVEHRRASVAPPSRLGHRTTSAIAVAEIT